MSFPAALSSAPRVAAFDDDAWEDLLNFVEEKRVTGLEHGIHRREAELFDKMFRDAEVDPRSLNARLHQCGAQGMPGAFRTKGTGTRRGRSYGDGKGGAF